MRNLLCKPNLGTVICGKESGLIVHFCLVPTVISSTQIILSQSLPVLPLH